MISASYKKLLFNFVNFLLQKIVCVPASSPIGMSVRESSSRHTSAPSLIHPFASRDG